MSDKYANIPSELKSMKNWVCWDESKLPKNPYTGKNAMSNNPSTWSDFKTAINAVEKFGFGGIGLVFDSSHDIFGVDLDKCLDDTDFVDEFVEGLRSYNEISRSGNGIHIICKGILPNGARRRGRVEMYSEGRYFIMTGNQYNASYTDIADCTERIKILHSKYMPDTTPQTIRDNQFVRLEMSDTDIIDKARACRTGQVFQLLYDGGWQGLFNSQSEADLALCGQLAFWCQKDEIQMDRIFRSSGLMRPKWDEKRGINTYGQITIAKAIASCAEVYTPRRGSNDTELALSLFGRKKPKNTKHYDMTDTGNAHRLYDRCNGEIRYSYTRKKWYYWTGKVWALDDTGEIKKYTDLVLADMKAQAFEIENEEERDKFLKFVTSCGNSNRKNAMVTETQHLDGIPVLPEQMDAYQEYLNVQNGIVNLRNGELMPHVPEFMMTKMCLSEYDVEGKKPVQWLKFLDDVCSGDQELVRYLQKCVGYSLTGSNREQCAFFLYGIGNNGKSTFLDTISDMLGGYAANAQPDTIMARRNDTGGGANSDIARLKSIRFVTTEEPSEGVRLNEGLVKQLTGGGKVTCRFLFGDEFEYEPEFKIWIATNHKPVIRGTDVGIWRRIRLIPFEVNIPKEKVDKNLKYKLREEMPQILRWAVEGCMMYAKEGLDMPDKVRRATDEYKNEMDLLQAFTDSCIEIDYGAVVGVPANELYAAYVRWAERNKEYVMTSRKFFAEIGKKLPEKKREAKGIVYKQIRLLDGTKQYSFSDFH